MQSVRKHSLDSAKFVEPEAHWALESGIELLASRLLIGLQFWLREAIAIGIIVGMSRLTLRFSPVQLYLSY